MHQTQGLLNEGMSSRQRFLKQVSAVRSESDLFQMEANFFIFFLKHKFQHIMPLLLQNPTKPLLPHVCFFAAPLSQLRPLEFDKALHY